MLKTIPNNTRVREQANSGFTLIELLIVVAIILVIAAIAIPNLLRSRMAANEASAAGSLRTINMANSTFLSTYGHSFAPTLAALGGTGAPSCTNSELLDNVLGKDPATKSGYTFTYTKGANDPGDALPTATPPGCGSVVGYTVAATPSSYQNSGTRSFFTDESGVIRGQDDAGAAATAGDPPIQ